MTRVARDWISQHGVLVNMNQINRVAVHLTQKDLNRRATQTARNKRSRILSHTLLFALSAMTTFNILV